MEDIKWILVNSILNSKARCSRIKSVVSKNTKQNTYDSNNNTKHNTLKKPVNKNNNNDMNRIQHNNTTNYHIVLNEVVGYSKFRNYYSLLIYRNESSISLDISCG